MAAEKQEAPEASVLAQEYLVSFSVATYNVLATAYVSRAWYPRTPAMVLDPAWRIPALVRHVSALNADLLCLQEIEPELLAPLRTELAAIGYSGEYARKGAGRPDGVAIFYRREKFAWISSARLNYADAAGAPADSGYMALIALFRIADRLLGVINTHLVWDPPGAALEARQGYRQACQLLAKWERIADSARAWIIAGDFNVTPDSALVTMIRQTGLDYAHRDLTGAATCNVKSEARMIDYLFHSPALHADPLAPPPVDDRTVLPSAEQPSDHVAIAARFAWKA